MYNELLQLQQRKKCNFIAAVQWNNDNQSFVAVVENHNKKKSYSSLAFLYNNWWVNVQVNSEIDSYF